MGDGLCQRVGGQQNSHQKCGKNKMIFFLKEYSPPGSQKTRENEMMNQFHGIFVVVTKINLYLLIYFILYFSVRPH